MYHTCTLSRIAVFSSCLFYYSLTQAGQWCFLLCTRVFSILKTKPVKERFGEWVVITGATDGIGEAIAKLLYSKNMNLFLISRDQTKLNETKKRIEKEKNNGVEMMNQIKVFEFDFSFAKWNSERFELLKKELETLNLGILVNNVGLGYPSAQEYNELSPSFIDDLISVNLRSCLQMTRMVLPQMRQRRRGAILCIGSGAGSLPSEPLYSGYVSVKGAVSAFCNSLKVECVKDNILVQCLTPLLITTKLSKIKRPSFSVLTPQKFAIDALHSIENESSSSYWTTATRCPSFVHEIILLLSSKVVPLGIWNRIRLYQTQDLRQRYMNKTR
ncbi:uncharacterized protein LOC128883492 [Hylaeus volcanicus]|uniref:uncharacterized protein LOC128883492 n=1 Tax=Hylaeus volcanicus TaxID=313075 RepID=UPI0023B8810F|nr:uncharacterized protein LOC128883492 [Hylaeus volcanicus]